MNATLIFIIDTYTDIQEKNISYMNCTNRDFHICERNDVDQLELFVFVYAVHCFMSIKRMNKNSIASRWSNSYIENFMCTTERTAICRGNKKIYQNNEKKKSIQIKTSFSKSVRSVNNVYFHFSFNSFQLKSLVVFCVLKIVHRFWIDCKGKETRIENLSIHIIIIHNASSVGCLFYWFFFLFIVSWRKFVSNCRSIHILPLYE